MISTSPVMPEKLSLFQTLDQAPDETARVCVCAGGAALRPAPLEFYMLYFNLSGGEGGRANPPRLHLRSVRFDLAFAPSLLFSYFR